MIRKVNDLETNGFIFNDEEDKEDFKNYITSNTTWEILELSKRLMPGDELNFYNIRNAGLCDYYFNKALFPVVKQFEHILKVHMNFLYTKSIPQNKQKINEICKRSTYIFSNSRINKMSDIFPVATLSELINTYNSISSYFPDKYKNFKKLEQVASLRNCLYHNNNVIDVFVPTRPSEHVKVNLALMTDRYALKLTDSEKNFVLTPKKNLYLAMCIIYYTDVMLSRSYSTQKIKYYTFEECFNNVKNAEKYYNNVPKGDKCASTYLAVLKRMSKQIIRISLDYKN